MISLLKSRDLELQQAAAKLLRSISVNERNRDRLARDGAISVLVKAIATTEDFTLKLAATASLWNLSVNGTSLLCPLDAQTRPHFRVWMPRLHTTIPRRFCSCTCSPFSHLAATFFRINFTNAFSCFPRFPARSWTDTDKNKRAIVEEGAVPMFVQLLQSNDVKLQNEAVGALRNLSLDGTFALEGADAFRVCGASPFQPLC